MGKRYGNIGGNYTVVDSKCIGCKSFEPEQKADSFGLRIGGHCKAGYCKRDAVRKRK